MSEANKEQAMLRVIKDTDNITIDQLKDHHLIVFEDPIQNKIGSLQNTIMNGYEARLGNDYNIIYCSTNIETIIRGLINTGYKVYCLNYKEKWNKIPILLKLVNMVTVTELLDNFDNYNVFFKKENKFCGMVRKTEDLYEASANTYFISRNLSLKHVINYLQKENYEILAERVIQ